MMRGRAAKAGAAGWRGAFAQGGEVLVFGLSGIDCRDAGGRCTTQARRARELISEAVAAVGVPVLAGPERVGEIFGAPGQSDKTRQIGSAHVRTPVTNAQLVCPLLLEKKITNTISLHHTPLTTTQLVLSPFLHHN